MFLWSCVRRRHLNLQTCDCYSVHVLQPADGRVSLWAYGWVIIALVVTSGQRCPIWPLACLYSIHVPTAKPAGQVFSKTGLLQIFYHRLFNFWHCCLCQHKLFASYLIPILTSCMPCSLTDSDRNLKAYPFCERYIYSHSVFCNLRKLLHYWCRSFLMNNYLYKLPKF